jgi:glycosyltransferase involved in cell wall biosynthesis
MKIGIDARVLMDKRYSGVSEYAANLLSALLKLDRKNEYRLFYNSFKPPFCQLEKWRQSNSCLIRTRYPNKIFNYFLQKIFKFPKLDKILKEVDIFFAPHFNFIRLSSKTKLVMTVHDVSFLRCPEFFSWRKNFWHRALGIKKLLRRADKIVAVSKNTKDDLIEILSLPKEKIEVIYSGNNYSTLPYRNKIEAEKFLQEKTIKPGFILFLGNIEPRKNISGLIEAYDNLREKRPDLAKIQLVIAGGIGWKHKKIFSAWRRSNYWKDIKFLGYIKEEEKIFLYQNAGVFVYPSFYEGFGFPPLEAMSFSVPVVSSNVSSLPEILEDSALLVDPYKSEEIEEAIILAITNKDLRDSLVFRGKKRAAEFFWEETAKSYLRLFESLYNKNEDRQEKE